MSKTGANLVKLGARMRPCRLRGSQDQVTDAKSALNHPQKVVDFGYRAPPAITEPPLIGRPPRPAPAARLPRCASRRPARRRSAISSRARRFASIRTWEYRESMARATCPAMLMITSSPAPDSASSITSVWRSSCHRLFTPANRIRQNLPTFKEPVRARPRGPNSDEPTGSSRVLFWGVLCWGFARHGASWVPVTL